MSIEALTADLAHGCVRCQISSIVNERERPALWNGWLQAVKQEFLHHSSPEGKTSTVRWSWQSSGKYLVGFSFCCKGMNHRNALSWIQPSNAYVASGRACWGFHIFLLPLTFNWNSELQVKQCLPCDLTRVKFSLHSSAMRRFELLKRQLK